MKANLAKPIKTKVCAACRQTLPLTAFQRNVSFGRVATCKACEAGGAQKGMSGAQLNNTAESAHTVQASLTREPRADAPLLAHTETNRVPAVVLRDGCRLSDTALAYLRAWGGR